jgi:hypothetical protein
MRGVAVNTEKIRPQHHCPYQPDKTLLLNGSKGETMCEHVVLAGPEMNRGRAKGLFHRLVGDYLMSECEYDRYIDHVHPAS